MFGKSPNEIVRGWVIERNRQAVGCLIPLSMVCGFIYFLATNTDKTLEFLKAFLDP